LPFRDWKTITWREGTNAPLKSRYARLRIRIARRDFERSEPWPKEWLLIEWPEGEKEPTKYWLSSLPANISFRRLVDTAKLRWRIERDYLELKQEVGLGHFEGRGWRGFHHHASLCIAAYGFRISERETIPPRTWFHRVAQETYHFQKLPTGRLHRVAEGGCPPPAPTDRGVRISRTTLFGSWFTVFTAICSSCVSMVS
jgi:hypothetical protein